MLLLPLAPLLMSLSLLLLSVPLSDCCRGSYPLGGGGAKNRGAANKKQGKRCQEQHCQEQHNHQQNHAHN